MQTQDYLQLFSVHGEGENDKSTVFHAANENVWHVRVRVCSLMLLVSVSSELFASAADSSSAELAIVIIIY